MRWGSASRRSIPGFAKVSQEIPRGRPKKVKNLRTDLTEELRELIPIREGERTYKISKQRAVLKSLFAKAVKGDSRSLSFLIALLVKIYGIEESALDNEFILTAEEQQLMASIQSRLIGKPDSESTTKTSLSKEQE